MRRVIIVGHSGQDGKLLTEHFLAEGAEVFGVSRRQVRESAGLKQFQVNISNLAEVADFVKAVQPGQVYYLAAHHHSSQEKLGTAPLDLWNQSIEVHQRGVVHFLEAIRQFCPLSRLFYAGSSLVFGTPLNEEQDEQTPMTPECAYGITKAAGLQTCRYYRKHHGVFAATGILYNHESIYREEKFVSQKIIRAALRILQGSKEKLVLGDLSARVDWGYAPEYVNAMTRILDLESAEDFIVASGTLHSIGDFVENVFSVLGLEWRSHVEESSGSLSRRRVAMRGNSDKLRRATGWVPRVPFSEMIRLLLPPFSNGR
jgi:GDPmannose 4,6-dehydratase